MLDSLILNRTVVVVVHGSMHKPMLDTQFECGLDSQTGDSSNGIGSSWMGLDQQTPIASC